MCSRATMAHSPEVAARSSLSILGTARTRRNSGSEHESTASLTSRGSIGAKRSIEARQTRTPPATAAALDKLSSVGRIRSDVTVEASNAGDSEVVCSGSSMPRGQNHDATHESMSPASPTEADGRGNDRETPLDKLGLSASATKLEV